MLINKNPVIAREGWPILFGVVLLAILLALISPWLALPVVLFFLFLLYLFRDPVRKVPPLPLAVVSPVDGKVLAVGQAYDPFVQRDTMCIELLMSKQDVFSIRSPIEGKMQQQWHDTSNVQEVKYAQCVQTDEKDQVVWGVKLGSPLKPRCYPQPGERLGQGQRCGYLMLGGKLVVYVPLDSRIKVKQGDLVRAGESEIATLVHQTPVSSITEEGNL